VYSYTVLLLLFFTLPSIAISDLQGHRQKNQTSESAHGVSFLMFVERIYVSFLNRDGKNVNVLTYYI